MGITEKYENPVEIYLNKLVDLLLPIFHKMKFSPNTLTFFSMLFATMSIYYLNHYKLYLYSLCLIVSFFFDCADGKMARKYNCLRFGLDLR